jgi:flagellar biosynthesis regulator FlaF
MSKKDLDLAYALSRETNDSLEYESYEIKRGREKLLEKVGIFSKIVAIISAIFFFCGLVVSLLLSNFFALWTIGTACVFGTSLLVINFLLPFLEKKYNDNNYFKAIAFNRLMKRACRAYSKNRVATPLLMQIEDFPLQWKIAEREYEDAKQSHVEASEAQDRLRKQLEKTQRLHQTASNEVFRTAAQEKIDALKGYCQVAGDITADRAKTRQIKAEKRNELLQIGINALEGEKWCEDYKELSREILQKIEGDVKKLAPPPPSE